MDKTVVVPVEPTEEMIDAAFNEFDRRGFRISSSDVGKEDIAGVFKAMIAAAPAPAADANLRLAQGEWEAFEKWAKDACIRNVQAAWDAWQARAARTAPQDAQERNAIIEECAKVCEELAATVLHPTQVITDRCASAIRALKTAQPADTSLRLANKPEPWTQEKKDELQRVLAEYKPEGKAERQVGCEGADGLLRIHAESETCDVCKAEQQAEPVAWMKILEDGYKCLTNNQIQGWTPLYTNPPAQPQQLTDDEVTPERLADCIPQTATFSAVDNYVRMTYQELQQFARALLTAGKERT